MNTSHHTDGSWPTSVPGAPTNALPKPAFTLLLNRAEVEGLRQFLAKGRVPADFETKLARLASSHLMHQFIADRCRLFCSLLIAVYTGTYAGISEKECDAMLKVLAYVRKDEDAVPDYLPSGFVDDLQEVRTVLSQHETALDRFKSWRLSHQVPRLWRN